MQVSVPPFPSPLTWEVEPASWEHDGGLTIVAPPRTDLFRDPAGSEPQAGAPRLLGAVEGAFQFSARVRCTFASTFDAGALLLWSDEARWVKLALEVSPDGEPGVVSVVTDGLSDDANAFAVEGDAVFLRVSRLGPSCALHARHEGEPWRFVRHFVLPAGAVRAGFLAQSPTGEGATARFEEIGFVAERLGDLRSGA